MQTKTRTTNIEKSVSPTTAPTTAAAITAALLLRIPHEFPARVWRRNVGGGVPYSNIARALGMLAHGKLTEAIAYLRSLRIVRYGLAGEADINGIVTVCGFGVRLEIEVKAEGDEQRDQQISYERMITKFGGIYIIARDVETAIVDLRLAVVALRDNRFAAAGR